MNALDKILIYIYIIDIIVVASLASIGFFWVNFIVSKDIIFSLILTQLQTIIISMFLITLLSNFYKNKKKSKNDRNNT